MNNNNNNNNIELHIPPVSDFDKSLLDPLEVDDNLLPFAEEYRKLQQALRKSHLGENRFSRKCRELVKNIKQNDIKCENLIVNVDELSKLKEQLSEQLQGTKEACEITKHDTTERRMRIKNLRRDENVLDTTLEQFTEELKREERGILGKYENEINELIEIRDKQRNELTQMRTESVEIHKQYQRIMDEYNQMEREKFIVIEKIQDCEKNVELLEHKKSDYERQIKDCQALVSDCNQKLNTKKELLVKAQLEFQNAIKQIELLDKTIAEQSQNFEDLAERNQAMQLDISRLQQQNIDDRRRVNRGQTSLEEEMEAVQRVKKDVKRKKKELSILQEKVKEYGTKLTELENEKQTWQQRVQQRKDTINELQSELNRKSKQMETCVREREVLNQAYQNKYDSSQCAEQALILTRGALRNIKNEYQAALSRVRQHTTIIDRLRREKSQNESDLARRLLQKAEAEEEMASLESKMAIIQKDIRDNETKYRQQQNLLDSVTSDKNLYRKVLIEQKAEMKEYERHFYHLNHNIKQLKQDITQKDMSFVTERLHHETVKADIETLQQSNISCKTRLTDIKYGINEGSKQIKKLTQILVEADNELVSQTKQYNTIVNEKRVLNHQLIQRNDELAKLYEKLRLQGSMLKKGREDYDNNRKLFIKLQKTKNDIERSLKNLQTDENDYQELQKSINHVSKNLNDQKLKVTLLEDELKKTLNVHRWRRLQDTNGNAYDLIKQAQNIQKLIIEKSEEVERKDAEIQKKERMYVDLRRILARQPGSDATEQLRLYETTLKEKRSKLQQLKSELKMYQTRANEYEYELDQLQNDMKLLKLEYFATRNRETQNARNHTLSEDLQNLQDDESIMNENDNEVLNSMREHNPTAPEPIKPLPSLPPALLSA